MLKKETLNCQLRNLDSILSEKKWGLCPLPKQWSAFWQALGVRIRSVRPDLDLVKPLILGGWSAPDNRKRRRFLEQLLTASDASLLDWAFDYLDHLSVASWYRPLYDFSFPEQRAPIYYFTGRGGSLKKGFVESFNDRCIDFDGREINGDFLKQDHLTQVDLIGNDLTHPSERIYIANSYGAYLLISYLINHAVEVDHLMLVSPITGSSTLDGTFFRPAGARALEHAINECSFKGAIKNLSVVVGQNDRQCDPDRCQLLAAAFKGRATVIPNQGHQISPNKLSVELDRFLATC